MVAPILNIDQASTYPPTKATVPPDGDMVGARARESVEYAATNGSAVGSIIASIMTAHMRKVMKTAAGVHCHDGPAAIVIACAIQNW